MTSSNISSNHTRGGYINDSKCIEGSSHYLGDKQDFDVSSKGPSSGN